MTFNIFINFFNTTFYRFPAHEYISGASKIPTVIYYDCAGNVKAVGAEAVEEGISEIAEDELWVKAEWYAISIFSLAVHFHINLGSNYISDLEWVLEGS